MLTRRLLASPSYPSSSLIRTFTTCHPQQRYPSLADLTSDGAAAFDARQKEFRDRVKAAQQAKEQQDSQLVETSTSSPDSSASTTSAFSSTAPAVPATPSSDGKAPTTSDPNDRGIASAVANKMSLDSLSSKTTGAERDAAFKQDASKRKGAISSLIYGTNEGRQMDQEIEKSFSQVLARGKYVHSIVFHQVKPDKVDEYIKLVGDWYPRMAGIKDNHVHLVGSWRTEVGDCDTFGMLIPIPRRVSADHQSPHLGIPTLPRLPRLPPLHLPPS